MPAPGYRRVCRGCYDAGLRDWREAPRRHRGPDDVDRVKRRALCTWCGKEQPFERFAVTNGKPDPHCNPCRAELRRAQRSQHRESCRAYDQARREVKERYLFAHLYMTGCCECGERRPQMLELDHRRGTHKGARNIARLVSRNDSLSRVEAEVAKCDVRCVACHRRRTARTYTTWTMAELPSMQEWLRYFVRHQHPDFATHLADWGLL